MHPLAREANFTDSLKKYLVDACKTVDIPITFDRSTKAPDLSGVDVNKWVAVSFGDIDYQNSFVTVDTLINVCTRQDTDWYENVRISDFIRSLFVDCWQTDGKKRIPLFDSQHGWKEIGAAIQIRVVARPNIELEDQTKVRPLLIRLWLAVTY